MGHHKYYSQNEIINEELITSLINQTSITKDDLVYDIGAGTGNITEALLAKGSRVISIEKDSRLYQKCRQRFLNRKAVSIHHADFLHWEFSPGHRYKVFSNIPFMCTADIIRKLVFNKAPPEDCYLIVQKQAAAKYMGVPKETLTSLLIKPKFWADVIYHFKRNDFSPVPAVDIVLLQLEKRKCRLVPESYYEIYRDFIIFCREISGGNLRQTLQNLFTYPQLQQISAILEIDLQRQPHDLNFMQYLCIFQFLLGDNLKKIALIRGAEAKLIQRRVKMRKLHRTNTKVISP